MIVAIIPARGGSKRIPRKNEKEFCGIPLVAWSIIQAKCSHFIDKVFVTTDDYEIAQIASEYGVECIKRPEWDNPDKISATQPILHAISEIKKLHNDVQAIVPILPTSPLNKPGDFDRGIYLFQKLGCDSIRPLINKRETLIMERKSDFRYSTVISNKTYNFLTEAAGWEVTKIENYEARFWKVSKYDSDQDDVNKIVSLEGYYFDYECWQYSDVDTEEEFKLAELLMEHYILKGENVLPYIKYKEDQTELKEMMEKYNSVIFNEFDRTIKEEVQEEIDISKYSGNSNQQ
jgi:CMP-N,N'-diacetyllegionaminic acid synthase